jgi:hypothetical protein
LPDDRAEPGAFEPELKPADARKQRSDRERHFGAPTGRPSRSR